MGEAGNMNESNKESGVLPTGNSKLLTSCGLSQGRGLPHTMIRDVPLFESTFLK